MKFTNSLHLLWFGFVILFGWSNVGAQGVCVIGEKKLSKFQGVVRQSDRQSIYAASIKLYRKNVKTKPILEVMSDANGLFEVQSLPDGKYIASYPNFVRLVFPIRIARKEKLDSRKLIVVLGWRYDEPCGGGEVLFEN